MTGLEAALRGAPALSSRSIARLPAAIANLCSTASSVSVAPSHVKNSECCPNCVHSHRASHKCRGVLPPRSASALARCATAAQALSRALAVNTCPPLPPAAPSNIRISSASVGIVASLVAAEQVSVAKALSRKPKNSSCNLGRPASSMPTTWPALLVLVRNGLMRDSSPESILSALGAVEMRRRAYLRLSDASSNCSCTSTLSLPRFRIIMTDAAEAFAAAVAALSLTA
mmetsp:Transcript_71826/g.136696  ORF Transcript_71826/g.136696 Transcript_71826/m.136696 type:complete len:229 (-) Transcript_71826:1478-2164(-)